MNLCMYLSNIRAMGGAKGGWFVVTIIFYKQIRVTSTQELDLKHFILIAFGLLSPAISKEKAEPVGGFWWAGWSIQIKIKKQ